MKRSRPTWLRVLNGLKNVPEVPRHASGPVPFRLPARGASGQITAQFSIRQGSVYGSDLTLELWVCGVRFVFELGDAIYKDEILTALKSALEGGSASEGRK